MQEMRLDVSDIIDAFRVIEAAINKGAFTAKELTQVMPVYTKLEIFLENYQRNQNEETNHQQDEQEKTQKENL